MRWWSEFWRQRKQDDRIKMISIFLVMALLFFGKAIYKGIQMYRTTGECTEYILQAISETGITDTKIRELEQMKEVECVSRQLETNISIMAGAEEVIIPCVGVSGEYMEQMWNVSDQGTMKQIFLNDSAAKQLVEKGISLEEKDVRVTYSVTDAEGIKTNETAKVFQSENLPKTEEPHAFCVFDNAKLSDCSNAVRVEVKGKDLDGQQLAKFQQMGYRIVNELEQKEERMRQEVEVLKIRYDVGVALICAIAVWGLRKARKS